MRLTVLALFAACALAACGQPAEKAPAEAAPAAATPAPVMPDDAPPQEEVTPVAGPPRSCVDEIGAEASAKLVQRCIAVSPATHPPCNAANDCASVQGEIDRACAIWTRDGDPPSECAG